MYCAVNSLKVKLKVRTVFQNVWGEYKDHGNPYNYKWKNSLNYKGHIGIVEKEQETRSDIGAS